MTTHSHQYSALLYVYLLLSSYALAFPSGDRLTPRRQVFPRDSTNQQGNLSTKIWVPVLVVVLLLAVIAIVKWRGRGLLIGMSMSMFTGGEALGAPVVQRTQELTAEQLAGSLRAQENGTTATAPRPRRTRRARRTPSQISTASLPAYMKEPGDEELVIFRGPQDMEDAVVISANGMPPVEELDAEGSMHSRNTSSASSYPAVPHTPNDQPLLNTDDQNDTTIDSSALTIPSTNPMPRRSVETFNSSEETSSLIRIDTNNASVADPRGEAPPYFEVVSLNASTDADEAPVASPGSTSSPSTGGSQSAPSTLGRRRSAFRSLFSALSHPGPRPPIAPVPHETPQNTSTRDRSGSGLSAQSESSQTPEARRTRASHHPSTSGSGSFLNLTSSAMRTISRQRSTNTLNSNRLNSPSLISLNSISSPLSHTLIRTDFTYPKSGPTPQQLQLISSRESFARFGMPYGADAIAFAASTSRHDLDPPPDFDVPGSSTHLPQAETVQASASPLSQSNSEATQPQDVGREALVVGSSSGEHTAPRQTSSELPTTPAETSTIPEPHTSTSLSTSPVIPKETTNTSAPPPSSKLPSSPMRATSRASSYLSYATADEFHTPNESETDLNSPSTPQQSEFQPVPLQHIQENTDITIIQGAVA